MELVRWNFMHICNASSSLLQTKLAISGKLKTNLHLPKPLSLSRRCIYSLSPSKNLVGQVNHLKEGGKMMWVIVTGFILCFGTPVCNNSALGQTLDLGQPQEMLDRCKEGMPIDAGVEDMAITNEGIVEEAWLIVNENFLDARHHTWSSEAWLKKKEEALSRPIQNRSTAHDIIRRMLSTLNDPYTRFLTPLEFGKFARYDLSGIGINLKEVSNGDGVTKLKVLGLILGGPAHSAGVKQGDEILSVNGKSVEGMTSSDVASLIQGPKETFVSLEVKHGDCGNTQSVIIERQQVVRTPVFYRLERGENENEDMGYIRLKEFNALARRDLTTAMQRLKDAGASHLVLDLRNNPGGLVQAGIEIAKLFLEGGDTVIYTVGRDLDSQKSIHAQKPAVITMPLMVLVNGQTASASEIVAASLHDNCRAILVGERTFGKGLIQSVYELKDGSAVAVTVGKYVTPSHRDIDGNGIEPDFRYRPGLVEAKQTLNQCRAPAGIVTRNKLL